MSDTAALQRYYDQSYPPSLWEEEALRAAQQPAPAMPGDVDQFTVAQVEAWVDKHPDQAAAVLDAEQAGKNRTTLVDWLTAHGAEPDDD